MLSLFECITRFSSLSMEEIKLFPIVNYIFHMSDFLDLYLNYISITIAFVFNLIVTARITYLLFMLKKIINICKYSIFNWFSFFSNLKRFLISSTAV